MKAPKKGKCIGETYKPLAIEKPADPMPKIPKGIFKQAFHNPNYRASFNYSIVQYLAQTPCAMSMLEVLQIFPT